MKPYTIIIFLSIFLASCERDVNVKIPYDGDKLVLNALFRNDSTIYAQLFLSQKLRNIYNAQVPAGAAIQLFENGVFKENMVRKDILGRPYFTSITKAKPNFVYTLKAAATNLPNAEGQDTVPVKPDARRISLTQLSGNTNYDYNCKFQITDPANTENFYMMKIYSADTNLSPIGPRYLVNSNFGLFFKADVVGSQTPAGIFGNDDDEELFFSDETFNGRNITIGLDFYGSGTSESHFVVEVTALTKSTYRYLVSRKLQDQSTGDPFAETTIVYNNIKNGYGIVGAANDLYVGFKK